MERLDIVSLAAGLGLIAVGILFMVDQGGSLELSAGVIAALLAALIGTILLVSGLAESRRE